ncbi:MAG TPA: redox-regulated ATPase YchF [Acidimicrobiia bacterium]|nr:redox-regulated ATPase YchF [Acidimicrobiia bacterium]
MEKLGLVGLPNSGKSSLFNALTGGNAVVAPHPFSTTETTVGIAQVPDERLWKLADMSESRKVVPAGVEFVDIAALAKGSSTGEGLGNRFLGSLREVDALVYVLRAFDDPAVGTPSGGPPDPADELATLEFELVLADSAAVEGRLHRQQKAAKGDKSLLAEIAALEKAQALLDEGTPLYRAALTADERELLRQAFLLTTKPILTVVNIGEDQLDDAAKLAGAFGEDALAVSVQLEAEAARLEPGERTELLEGLGLGEGVVPRVAHAAYHLLGRRTFLTTGDKESRAWTFRAGARAPECAGVIHSDLQRGFIRAEVIRWDELLSIGSWTRAKEQGKLRVEGKDYEVADGDVLEIRFNV